MFSLNFHFPKVTLKREEILENEIPGILLKALHLLDYRSFMRYFLSTIEHKVIKSELDNVLNIKKSVGRFGPLCKITQLWAFLCLNQIIQR